MNHITHVSLSKKQGGGEHQLILLAKSLSKLGVSQTLICRKENLYFFNEKLPKNINFITASGPFSKQTKYSKGLFHAHCGRSVYWRLIHKKIFPKTKYIITRRVINPVSHHYISHAAYQKANTVVTVSNAINHVLKKCIPNISPQTVYDAINLPGKPIIKKEIHNKKYYKILQVGNISSHKGYETTIAISKILKEHFTLIIVGKDDDVILAKSLSLLPNVQYLGYQKNLAPIYKNSDMFLFPSKTEGLDSSILEAMSYGLPIVASKCGGIPEIVKDQINGFIIQDYNNPKKFIEAIYSITENEEKYKKISDENIMYAKKFSSSKIANAYLDIYMDA